MTQTVEEISSAGEGIGLFAGLQCHVGAEANARCGNLPGIDAIQTGKLTLFYRITPALCKSFRSLSLLLTQTRIKGVTQGVAKEVERHHGQGQKQARIQQQEGMRFL